MTVLHVVGESRSIDAGTCRACGAAWRPGDPRHLRTTEMLPGFPARPLGRARAHIAGSVLRLTPGSRVVLCGSGASTASPERGVIQGYALCSGMSHLREHETRTCAVRLVRRSELASIA